MSHFSVIKCSIKNVNINTLKQAFLLIGFNNILENAKVSDYSGRTNICSLVIPTDHGGVGINITENGIEIITDRWFIENRQIAEKIEQNINQYYTTVAFQNSLAKLGYKVSVEKKQDKVLVHAW